MWIPLFIFCIPFMFIAAIVIVVVIIAYGNIKLSVGVHSLFDIFYHPENALVAIVKGLSEIGFLALCVTRR